MRLRFHEVFLQILQYPKVGLISDGFSLWLKSPQKKCQITILSSPEHLLYKWILLKTMIWYPFFGLEPK